jgi:hypothetical protein
MATWEDVLEIAAELPEVEVSTWFRTPALRVRKKGFVRLRDEDGGLVVLCDLDEKAALLARGDPTFYTTPHYDGDGAILVNLARIDYDVLSLLISRAWCLKAPAKLRKEFPEFERTETHGPAPASPAPASPAPASEAPASEAPTVVEAAPPSPPKRRRKTAGR